MFERTSDEQAELDTQLFNICHKDDDYIDLFKLEEILKKGANPNSLHKWQAFSNLYRESSSRFPLLQIVAGSKNPSEAAELLLSYGADLTITDPHTGNTVLHTAIALKKEAYTIFLIEKIKNNNKAVKLLDQKDTKHDWLNSPMILAFKKGQENIVRVLIDAGADANLSDRYGSTPLHWAALLRYNDVIEQLLKRGADPGALTKYNHSPLELYQYNLGPLDFELKLKYVEKNKTAHVIFTTNLPEISDNRFHGFHRKHQDSDNHICHLLVTKPVSNLTMNEQYIKNFQIQDAIARSAKGVAGYEYEDSILRTLKKEGERFYGNTALPDYAPTISKAMFSGKREVTPNYQQTLSQIIDAMNTNKETKIKDKKDKHLTTSQNKISCSQKSEKNDSPIQIATKSFITSPIHTSPKIPQELQTALKDGGVQIFIDKKKVTLDQLIDIYDNKPWVIGALKCFNIRNGILNNFINLEELTKLHKEQVNELKHKFEDDKLKSEVEKYIKQNEYDKRFIADLD